MDYKVIPFAYFGGISSDAAMLIPGRDKYHAMPEVRMINLPHCHSGHGSDKAGCFFACWSRDGMIA